MRIVKESELVKSARVNVRISNRMAAWLERKAGKERSKASVIRSLIEREMAREAAARLTEVFDAAASHLTEEDRGDRELIAAAFADRQ